MEEEDFEGVEHYECGLEAIKLWHTRTKLDIETWIINNNHPM